MGNTIEDHNEPVCANVGHGVACVTLVRCGHRESFTATCWVSLSGGDDAWEPVTQRELQFGPFDDIDEISVALGQMLRSAIMDVAHMDLGAV